MANAAKKQMNIWEQKYHDITELYALSDDLLATVEQAANPEAQLELVAPLVEIIGESADVLTEEYIGLCDQGPAGKPTAKSRIEGAMRKVYVALNDCSARAKDARNAVHAIIKQVKRQLEQVIVHFVDFVTLSVERIMQKQDVEELKQRHASIALMLHTTAQKSPAN